MKEESKKLKEKKRKIQIKRKKIQELINEIKKVIIGQEELIIKTIIALLSNGHVLIEGVPGLAKTLLIKTLAEAMNLKFKRIQFTPDLLPSDIIGTEILTSKGNFSIRLGPIFANLILADEINRAPPKVQSALLEAMQEKQVTIGKKTFKLEEPFFVMATQNPIENQGTYPLPEAELDRFFFKILVDYPKLEEEMTILERYSKNENIKIKKVIDGKDIIKFQKEIKNIYLDPIIQEYIAKIIDATRYPENYGLEKLVRFGSSPRGSINLAIASKAVAWLNGREYVKPEDIKYVAKDVLRHRIILTYDAQIDNINPDQVIDMTLERIEEP